MRPEAGRGAAVAARLRWAVAVVVFQLITVACNVEAEREWVDLPLPADLPQVGAVRKTTITDDEADGFGSSLGSPPDTVWQYGSFDSPSGEVLAEIEEAAWLSGRGFVVLDRQSSRLLLLSEGGSVTADLVAPGSGPGEFADPLHVAVTPEGTILVLDRAARLQEFAVDEEGFAFKGSVNLAFLPDDICALRGEVVGVGLHPQFAGLIHVFGPDGKVRRSFGEGYRHESFLVARSMSLGALACSAGAIAVAFRRFGEVHAYSSGGDFLWAHRLKPFLPFINQVGGAGQELRSGLERGFREKGHYVLTFTATHSGYLLQMGVRSVDALDEGRPYESVDTYLIGSHGEGVTSQRWGTGILALGDSTTLGYSLEPWPTLFGLPLNPET